MPTNKGGYSAGGGVKQQKRKNETSSEDDDDENFEEPAEQQAIPKFLINIPGVTATDSMGYRIEALRVHLER